MRDDYFRGPDGRCGTVNRAYLARGVDRYDSITDQYARFLIADVLPALKTTCGLSISDNPEARGLVGISSSGVCALCATFCAVTMPS